MSGSCLIKRGLQPLRHLRCAQARLQRCCQDWAPLQWWEPINLRNHNTQRLQFPRLISYHLLRRQVKIYHSHFTDEETKGPRLSGLHNSWHPANCSLSARSATELRKRFASSHLSSQLKRYYYFYLTLERLTCLNANVLLGRGKTRDPMNHTLEHAVTNVLLWPSVYQGTGVTQSWGHTQRMSPLPPWNREAWSRGIQSRWRCWTPVHWVLNEGCEPTSQNVCSANEDTCKVTATWTLFGVRGRWSCLKSRDLGDSQCREKRNNLEAYLDYKYFMNQNPPVCLKL